RRTVRRLRPSVKRCLRIPDKTRKRKNEAEVQKPSKPLILNDSNQRISDAEIVHPSCLEP
ncbi:hypothetical protein Q4511_12550, partial [Paracoccus sp. 1_MG-2023]|uniref:hypothetical protein n=1 Tax=Paracoccus sp. 1_MG-2023 TaxID=3062651 RepID=UPI0026E3F753